jgi:hypothetical protein
MNSEPSSIAAAALCRRLRLRWQESTDVRAEFIGDGVVIYLRGECLGTWLAVDRQYEFRPSGDWTNGVVAHTILGAVAFTEGIIQGRT